MMSLTRAKRAQVALFAAFGAAILVGVTVGVFAPEYYLVVLAAAFGAGVLASATDLSMGLGGVLNLGPALSFGLGSYITAIAQKSGVPFLVGLMLAIVIGAGVVALFGIVGLSRRRSTIQFALFTLVASISCEQIAISSTSFLGGSNGIPNIVIPMGLHNRFYFFLYLSLVTFLFSMLAFVKIRYEDLLILQRDEPEKAEALGYDPKLLKILVMATAGAVGAVAGAAYVPFSGIAYPGLFAVMPNLLVLVWIALGGRATIIGPFLAALILTVIEFELGSVNAHTYLLALGVSFVAVVALAPRGLWPFAFRNH